MSTPSKTKDWDTLVPEFKTFLQFERKMSPRTVDAYMRDITQFRAAIEPMKPAEATRQDIEGWLAEVYDRGAEPTSQARKISGLRCFYNFLQLAGGIEKSPVEFIDAPKIGRKLPDVLTIAEIDAMLGTIDLSAEQGHRNRAMLETLYSCGLRVTELVELRLGDLFFEEGFIRVTGKGDKQRLVPISTEAQRQITLWMGRRREIKVERQYADIVFINRLGRKLSRVMVFNVIKNAAAAAGVTKNVSPHTLRHSFATHLLEGGASIRQVQDMLGHESILTTEIYTHLDRTALRKSIEKHHPLNQMPM